MSARYPSGRHKTTTYMRKSIIYILILSLALGACEKNELSDFTGDQVPPVGIVLVSSFDEETRIISSFFTNQFGEKFETKLSVSPLISEEDLFHYLKTSEIRKVRYESISQEYVTEDLSLVPAEGNLEITNFDDNLK